MKVQRSCGQRVWDFILGLAKMMSPGTQDPAKTGEIRDVTSPAPAPVSKKKRGRSHLSMVRSRKSRPERKGWSRQDVSSKRPKGRAGY